MQQVVTLVGLETKGGNGANGPWTLWMFKDGGGNKYQTFDNAIGQAAQALLQQQATVTYIEETRNYTDRNGNARTGINKVLQSIAAGALPGAEAAPQAQQAPQGTPQPQGGSQDQWRRSKDELRRSEALAHAIQLHNNGLAKVSSYDQLLASADFISRFLENGPPAAQTSAAPPTATSEGVPATGASSDTPVFDEFGNPVQF